MMSTQLLAAALAAGILLTPTLEHASPEASLATAMSRALLCGPYVGPDGTHMCVEFFNLPGGNTAVTVAPCTGGTYPATLVPSSTNRRVASDCFGEYYYVAVPTVPWADADCEDITVQAGAC